METEMQVLVTNRRFRELQARFASAAEAMVECIEMLMRDDIDLRARLSAAEAQVATLTAERDEYHAALQREEIKHSPDWLAMVAERDVALLQVATGAADFRSLMEQYLGALAGQAMLREALEAALKSVRYEIVNTVSNSHQMDARRTLALIDAALAASPGDCLAGERRRVAERAWNLGYKAGVECDAAVKTTDLAALLKVKP